MSTSDAGSDKPLRGIRVVEAGIGITALGAGLAVSLPGGILRDLGASVTVVRPADAPALDTGVGFRQAWDQGKTVAEGDAGTVADRARDADILIVAGPENNVERAGLTYEALSKVNPRLILARIRPSVTEAGPIQDYELLVAARAGLLTQIRGHRPGPVANDLAVGSAGAGLSAAAGALALLYQREATGTGGWAETSLYDGLTALLPMIIGSVEHHSPTTRLLWQNQGPSESLCYRCADGEYVQLWFGAKGAFEAFLDHIGDPPSEAGYNAELAGTGMKERGERWSRMFAEHDRDWWVADLAGQKFRCEPALRPGEARTEFPGPALTVAATGARGSGARRDTGTRLLEGVRVLDLSAYLAGPVAPLILGEFGADVVKVEPPSGDVHRNMVPMFAAGQRGKRAAALDLKGPDAGETLAKMFRWADVVHHNSRVGLAEKLGYDDAAVYRANPDAVYSFASGFGETGPRAALPANDQLMQAIAGIETGQGGAGQPPVYLVWGAVDAAGGWLAACGIIAGLYARRAQGGGGQRVSSHLAGAALLLKSGSLPGSPGPALDAAQTGYGAAYRIYQCRDDRWLAIAVPDDQAWQRLRSAVGVPALPGSLPFAGTDNGPCQSPARLLESAFSARDASDWAGVLRSAGVPAEVVAEPDREEFAAGFTADPVAVSRGRVVSYIWDSHGVTRQPCFPALGPVPRPPAMSGIPGLGEHTDSFLKEL